MRVMIYVQSRASTIFMLAAELSAANADKLMEDWLAFRPTHAETHVRAYDSGEHRLLINFSDIVAIQRID